MWPWARAGPARDPDPPRAIAFKIIEAGNMSGDRADIRYDHSNYQLNLISTRDLQTSPQKEGAVHGEE